MNPIGNYFLLKHREELFFRFNLTRVALRVQYIVAQWVQYK